MERREFLKHAALGTASLASPARSALGMIGANDRVNLGLVGAGGRGRLLMGLAAAIPNVQFVAVCDLFRSNRRGRAAELITISESSWNKKT
jgi:predicted homoserine dehydrogenase-like protein